MREQIRLDINYVKFKKKLPKAWWGQTDHVEKVLKLVKASGLLPFNYMLNYSNRYVKIKDLETVVSAYKKAKTRSRSVDICKEKDDLKDYLRIYMFESSFGLTLSLTLYNDIILQQLTELFWQIYDLLKEEARFGPSVAIRAFKYSYPRRREMKNYEWLGSSSYINFIQPSYFENVNTSVSALKTFYEKGKHDNLLTLDLPQGVTRIKRDDVYCIQWLASIEDEDAFKKAMMVREDWCYKHLNLDPCPGFNAYGDGELMSVRALKDVSETESFITYYYKGLGEAYAVCILEDEHKLPVEVQKKIKHYIKTKKCDSGAPIDSLSLITTTRERAVAINTQARQLGCHKVYYLDDYCDLWDLCPEGNWREPCPYDVDVVEVKI